MYIDACDLDCLIVVIGWFALIVVLLVLVFVVCCCCCLGLLFILQLLVLACCRLRLAAQVCVGWVASMLWCYALLGLVSGCLVGFRFDCSVG